MDRLATQLALPMVFPVEETFKTYVSGPNEQAFSLLDQLCRSMPEWKLQPAFSNLKLPLLNLVAGAGRGKSHLLYACCHELTAKNIAHQYVDLATKNSLTPAIFEGLEVLSVVCLDNLQALAGEHEWEEALFDLFNRVLENQNCVVITTSRFGAQHSAFHLADLRSRLLWGLTFTLDPLSDHERMQVVAIRAEQKGLHLSAQALQFLLNHTQRDLPHLVAVLERLDKRSLQEQRKLSVALVKRELGLD